MVNVLTTDPNDVERCRHSLLYRDLLTITAMVDGTIRPVNGVVMSIEPIAGLEPTTWKISIEEDPADPAQTLS